MSKDEKNIHNQKHLTLSDRTYIEQELLQGSTFKAIAQSLQKDPTTIAKEVKKHRQLAGNRSYGERCKRCKHWGTCTIRGGNIEITGCPKSKRCKSLCRRCSIENPTLYCTSFLLHSCKTINHPPYVCNACPKERGCYFAHFIYRARHSQIEYEKTLAQSREGINMTQEELEELNNLISPLVLKGQPLSHIFAVHADEIPVCRRTLYNYLDMCVFKARNIDLPRRIRYKKRKKRSEPRLKNVQQTYRNKRTYVDFEKYTKAFPDLDIVEMDTVKGSRAAGKCLLTLLFRSCSFMIIILLPNCTQQSVINAINNLCDTIGIRTFKKYFPIILTDNGPEFKNPWDIEKNDAGTQRTRVFYCDPYVSNQKGRIEKNHEYIRYIIPKGRSMYKYTQDDINLMASHINSTARDGLNGASPFDLAALLLDKKIPQLVGQFRIPPDNICLKPALIEGNVTARITAKKEGGDNNG
ncbi:MAG: IS30 family transposase [Lachnospiraceae bacterium]|nr:IS30 family transposase [Lachnospiraceae bacterium]